LASWGEMEQMLIFFDRMKLVLYRTSSDNLRNSVILDIGWIIDRICVFIRDHETDPLLSSEVQQLGLAPEVKNLKSHGLLSEDLIHYFWQKDEMHFLIDFMRSTFLFNEWPWESRDRTFLLPSVLPWETLQNNQNLDAAPESTHWCEIRFRLTFIPLGVFERFVCLCLSYVAATQNVPAPELKRATATLYLNGGAKLHIQKHASVIRVSFGNRADATRNLRIIVSLLRRIEHDYPGNLGAVVFLQCEGKLVQYSDARRLNLEPWLLGESGDIGQVEISLQNFLHAL